MLLALLIAAGAVTHPNQCTFVAAGTGAVARQCADKYADTVSVKDFGAKGDGTTDNATAFAAVAAVVNATSGITVYFPDGTYNYSGGLVFTKPVRLFGGTGAILNYTGSSVAVKMGADGLLVGTYDPNPYEVDGLTFTGGASSTQGIYFNTFITNAKVHNTYFLNFGSATGYAIFFQSQNWDARVFDVKMYANDANKHNFVRANGIAADGTTSDFGQSLLTVTNVLATNQATATGTVVGIYTGGAFSRIINNKLEGFSPVVWLGSNAGASSNATRIQNVTMETVRGSNPCIIYGESTGSYTSVFTVDVVITDSYCNTHNTDFATTSHFLGPAAATNGLQGIKLFHNLSLNQTAGQPIVVMNNLGGQTNNQAQGNRQGTAYPDSPPNPLHTAGGSITAWVGTDELFQTTATGLGFGGTSAMASFGNGVDTTGVVQFKAGATVAETMALNFLDFNNTLIGDVECSGSGGANACTLKGPGGVNSAQFTNTGLWRFLKGIDGDGAGAKHKRVAGCATAASLAATCTTTITWGTTFADANYTAICNGDVVTSGVPLNGGLTAKVAASVTFQTVSGTAAAAQYTTIDCIAFHD